MFWFLGVGWDCVHLVRRPLFDLLYQPRMIDDACGAVGGMRIGRGNGCIRRKPAPVQLCPPQIPHDLTWDWTRPSAVGSRRLTAWAMARPSYHINYSFILIRIENLLRLLQLFYFHLWPFTLSLILRMSERSVVGKSEVFVLRYWIKPRKPQPESRSPGRNLNSVPSEYEPPYRKLRCIYVCTRMCVLRWSWFYNVCKKYLQLLALKFLSFSKIIGLISLKRVLFCEKSRILYRDGGTC
jgi:hypothetical protein